VKRGGELVGVRWEALADRLRASAEGILARASVVSLDNIEAAAGALMLGH
jgi:hypothetical protein